MSWMGHSAELFSLDGPVSASTALFAWAEAAIAALSWQGNGGLTWLGNIPCHEDLTS